VASAAVAEPNVAAVAQRDAARAADARCAGVNGVGRRRARSQRALRGRGARRCGPGGVGERGAAGRRRGALRGRPRAARGEATVVVLPDS
jgi:hypothetical protein